MTLTEILTMAADITGRSDFVATGVMLKLAQQATLEVHGLEFFPKDLVVSTHALGAPTTQVTLDTKVNCPRSKGRFALVRAYDSATGVAGQIASKEELDTAIDTDGITKLNIYYLAGNTLNIKFSNAVSGLLLGYYVHPVVDPALSYASWVADEYPYAIVINTALKAARLARDSDLLPGLLEEAKTAKQYLLVNYLYTH